MSVFEPPVIVSGKNLGLLQRLLSLLRRWGWRWIFLSFDLVGGVAIALDRICDLWLWWRIGYLWNWRRLRMVSGGIMV
jgi:hypothetical protein